MLQLYDLNKNKIRGLKAYKDYKIESVLTSGDKTLSFLYPSRLSREIKEECYIRNKKDEFVVKAIDDHGEWKSITAKLNVEDLEGKEWESFNSTEQTVKACLTLAIVSTGWIVGTCNVTRRRTVRKSNCSAWDILQEVKKRYRCEFEFDTINKKINIYEKLGNDKGVYFIDSLNLKDINVQSNSYDFYTRIIAKGKDDLRVVVENFQYSTKVKTKIWKDERYSNLESLREDAQAKLNELSKPYRAYNADIIDLANIKEEYKILSYKLGDTITLISKEKGIREKQRIVKIIEYPDEPEKNSCEIANTLLSFEDIQKEFYDTTDTVNNITTDNGTIDGNAIDEIGINKIRDFKVNVLEAVDITAINGKFQNLYSVTGTFGEVLATKVSATELESVKSKLQEAIIAKADITDTNIINAKIKVLEAESSTLKTILNGNLSSENIQTGGITGDKLNMNTIFVKDANIIDISANKIKTGSIDTGLVTIVGAEGKLKIADNTIQIRDATRVRVQIGKDASNDYNMYVWDNTGKLMFDATGLKADGIKNKIIRDDMISDNANIDGSKLNINSVVTSINNGTTTIKGSRVEIDATGQTLDVSFNSLKTNVEAKENRNLLRNSDIEKTGDTEFIQYADIAPILDKYGLIEYTISFDLKSKNISRRNIIQVYCQNGSGAKYYIGERKLEVTTEYKRYYITVTPQSLNSQEIKSLLAFYGEYGTGNIPVVRNVKIEIGRAVKPIYSKSPEDVDQAILDVKEITTSNSTSINVMQGQISTAINNTQIIKDGQTILLKDDYNRIVIKVDSINSMIGSHSSSINDLTGQVTNVDTKVNAVRRDLDGTISTVSAHTSQINGLNSIVNNQGASITQLLNKIDLKVEQTQVTNTVNSAINGLEIGSRNYVRKLGGTIYDINSIYAEDRIRATFESVNSKTFIKYTGYSTLRIALIKIEPNTTYTWSFSVYTVGTDTITCSDWDGTSYGHKNYSISTKLTRVSHTFTSKETSSYEILHISSITNSDIYYFADFTLVKGNKPMIDWVSALEDNDQAILDVNTKVETVKNNVTNITLDLNSISSKVSSVEQTTTTINNNLTAMDSRMSTAEQKITSNAIISTVQATINTAKQEAINSANSSTDGKLNNYATTSALNSAITQQVNNIKLEVSNTFLSKNDASGIYATKASMDLTSTQLKLDFSQSGGMNITPNGGFKYGTKNWYFTEYNAGGTAKSMTVWNDSSQYCLDGRNTLVIRATDTSGEVRVDSQKFKVKRNCWYTISYLVAAHRCPKVGSYIRGNEWNILSSIGSGVKTGGKNRDNWTKHAYSFYTGDNYQISVNLIIFNSDTDGYAWFTDVMINEGKVELPWTPNPEEIYSGNTVIDRDGVAILNGALTVKNNSGQIMLQGDSNGNLSFQGRLQPYDHIIKLFGEDCRIDANENILRLQKNRETYISIDNSELAFYTTGNNKLAMNFAPGSDSPLRIWGNRDGGMLKFRRDIYALESRNSSDNGYGSFIGSAFNNGSRREFKENIKDISNLDFTKIVMENNIVTYNYKSENYSVLKGENGEFYESKSQKLGLIIEDLTSEADKYIHPLNTDGIDVYSMCSVLWKVVQEQQKRIEALEAAKII